MIKRDRGELIDMFTMRVSGNTLQEIGNKYGISRERVRQILASAVKEPKVTWNGIIYPNLKKWMMNRNISMRKFGKILGFSNPGLCEKKLKGLSSFNLKEVNKVLEITGMSFNETFKTEEKTC